MEHRPLVLPRGTDDSYPIVTPASYVLPLALRILSALLVVVVTAVLVLWRPGGRPAEEWAFVLLRYCTASRVAVWRPQERDGGPSALREVVLPPAPAPSGLPGKETDDAA